MAPELKRVRHEPEPAPALGPRRLLRLRRDGGLELRARADRLRLARRCSAAPRGGGTRLPVRIGLLGRNTGDDSLDAHLHLGPPEEERRARVRVELAPLARRVAGEERESALVRA